MPRRRDCLDLRESSAAALKEDAGSSDMTEESSVILSRDRRLSTLNLARYKNGWCDIGFEPY